MDKQETEILGGILLQLSLVIASFDNIHKLITEHLIQKGAPNIQDPNNFDHRGN